MIFATAGHVDHGKTSLIKALTGVDTDRLAEEKKRGLTIELGFAYSESISDITIGFVDVPGHSRFISNMLAGVSSIDAALLVIACDDGVMPQTIEHLRILEFMGITEGIIVLTKVDRCEADDIRKTENQVREKIDNTFLQGCPLIPVSSNTGQGLNELKKILDDLAKKKKIRDNVGLFRLSVDRRFLLQGTGIVATGTVSSGSVKDGDEIWLMPSQKRVKARSLRVNAKSKKIAGAGDRCAINLVGSDLKLEDIGRGNWLTTNPGKPTREASSVLKISEEEKRNFKNLSSVHFYSAANHVLARIALLDFSNLPPGASCFAKIILESEINLCYGDHFLIRDQSATRTVGGGRIVYPYPLSAGRKTRHQTSLLSKFDMTDRKKDIVTHVQESPAGLRIEELSAVYNLSNQNLMVLTKEAGLFCINEAEVISVPNLKNLKDLVIQTLKKWHQENKGESGVPESKLIAILSDYSTDLLRFVFSGLIDQAIIIRNGNTLSIPEHNIQLTPMEEKTLKQISPILANNLLKPPVLHDLANHQRTKPQDLERILNQIAKTGRLIRLTKNRFFLPEALPAFREALFKSTDNNQISVQGYRDQTGIGRNLSIEILEYFDRKGITRRVGDKRQIIQPG